MKRLPVLELDDGTRIFSSNAAARFLFSINKKIVQEVDMWLKWDSVTLQPALFSFNPEKPSDSKFFQLLEQLEKTLKGNTFLVNVRNRYASLQVVR